MIIYGINPVLEALRAGRVREVRVSDRGGDRLLELVALATRQHVGVKRIPQDALARQARGGVHQGVVAEVVNIARAIEELKDAGVWSVGLAGEAPASYDTMDFTGPTALVLGAEGAGLRRLVRERCDFLAAIPMQGHVGSLNVSVAAGVTLFEAARQRRARDLRGVRNKDAERGPSGEGPGTERR